MLEKVSIILYVLVIAPGLNSNLVYEKTCACGKSNFKISKIYGGYQARLGEFPWLGKLYAGYFRMMFLLCGGSLISNEYVLTAAHCLVDWTRLAIRIEFGVLDYNSKSHDLLSVAKMITHAAYDFKDDRNDIALLKLSRKVKFSKLVSPICLPMRFKRVLFDNTLVTVCGWGETQRGTPKTLMATQLKTYPLAKCMKYHNVDYVDKFGATIFESNICTADKIKDACLGDSGGPMSYYDPRSKRSYIIGIVSWGIDCTTIPAAYTRVTSYLDWIKEKAG